MSSTKNRQGFVNLGVIGLIVLTASLFAVSKLASNPDLTFFNIGSQAASAERQACKGCDGTREKRWDSKKRSCVLRESRNCGEKVRKDRQIQKEELERAGSDLPPCDVYGTGLYCTDSPTEGAVECLQNKEDTKGWFCCPIGKKIVDRVCK